MVKLPEFITREILNRFNRTRLSMPCDLPIGGRENPYLERWFIIPRNPIFNIYLHRILRSDDDRALHDHPWWSVSLCLDGEMREHLADETHRTVERGDVVLRSAEASHRLELTGDFCITLFVTGPKIREWGFHCPESSPAGGWRHWKVFTSFDENGDSTRIGRGCGEE